MNISLAAEPIFHIHGFTITNSLLASWIVVIFLVFIAFKINLSLKSIPSGLQNFFEFIIESLYNLVEQVAHENTKKIFPFIITFFMFILFSNWMGLIPGVGSIGFYEKEHGKVIFIPLIRSASADLNTTLALGLISVIGTQIFAFRALGFKAQISKYLNFKGLIEFFVGILELLSEIARVISFAFRLFGNIFAGEVLLTTIAFLMPTVLSFISLPFLGLEVFVGFIQALVFTMLTLVFLTVAMTSHDEGHNVAH